MLKVSTISSEVDLKNQNIRIYSNYTLRELLRTIRALRCWWYGIGTILLSQFIHSKMYSSTRCFLDICGPYVLILREIDNIFLYIRLVKVLLHLHYTIRFYNSYLYNREFLQADDNLLQKLSNTSLTIIHSLFQKIKNPTSPSDLRPICLLSPLSKVLEKIMKIQLWEVNYK